MIAPLERIAFITVPRAALLRALAVGGPLVCGLILVKLIKLAVQAAYGAIPDNLFASGFEYLISTVGESVLLFLVLIPASLVAAATVLARRSQRKAWWIAGLPLAYLVVIVGVSLRAEPDVWHPQLFVRLGEELRDLAQLWWQEALVAIAIIGLLSVYFARGANTSAAIIRLATLIVLPTAYGLLMLDLGYLLVTRSALTTDDLLYALDSPVSALTLIRESVSMPVGLALLAPILGIAIVRFRNRNKPRPERPAMRFDGRTVRLGLLLWPALVVAFGARVAAATSSLGPLYGTALVNVPMELLVVPLKRALFLHESAHPSARVPELPRGEITVAATERTQPLNVVIVLLESARADATTLYTPALPTTPFLVDLARESLVVDDMYAVMPRSSAARLATLSGQYPATGDMERTLGNAPGERRPLTSLPRLLRSRGYTSAYYTPATLQFENDSYVIRSLDFDEVVSLENVKVPANSHRIMFGLADQTILPNVEHWLDTRAADRRPFLLTLVSNVGHYPYDLPPGFERHAYASRNDLHQRYLNCVHYLDGYVHDVVTALRERNLLENTVLVVLGDHGEEFYDHGTFVRGQTLFEESLHIPMLIRLPQAANRTGRIAGLRQQIDVLPTIVDALGLELHDNVLPGRSILSTAGHPTLFFSGHLPGSLLAMRSGNRKYVYNVLREQTSVFDLDRDPAEQQDLSDDVSFGEIAQVAADLRAWQVRVRRTF
jgi:arylsulfatase A-like enzyme